MGLDFVYDEAVTFAIGALAALDCIGLNTKIDGSRKSGMKVVKSEIWVDYAGKTDVEGPVLFGVAALLNAAEIEVALEADPQGRANVENNQSRRPVWPLLMIAKDGTKNVNRSLIMPLEVKPSWSIPEGEDYTYWAYNMDTSALTSGLVLEIFAKHTGVWLKD